jgi:hypothetical protein
MSNRKMVKFSLIHPSRSRPEMAYKAYQTWMDNASQSPEYVLSLDINDPKVKIYNANFNDINIVISPNQNVVQATNNGCKHATGDMLIYVSDDFDCPVNWDMKLTELIEKHKLDPLKDAFAIEVRDGYQTNRNLLTIPIISRAMYEAEGFFWHPKFASMFCDNWIYERAKRAYKLIDGYHLTFQHNHYSLGHYAMDETNKRSNANWMQGKKTFNSLSERHGYKIQYK